MKIRCDYGIFEIAEIKYSDMNFWIIVQHSSRGMYKRVCRETFDTQKEAIEYQKSLYPDAIWNEEKETKQKWN